MKQCARCELVKPYESFNKKGDGFQPYCRECQSVRAKSRYANHAVSEKARLRVSNQARAQKLREEVEELKKVPCKDCGIQYPPYVMDFDHVSGTKIQAVSVLWRSGVSRERILEEISKCEVVCANCHRERTHQRRVSIRASSNWQDTRL